MFSKTKKIWQAENKTWWKDMTCKHDMKTWYEKIVWRSDMKKWHKEMTWKDDMKTWYEDMKWRHNMKLLKFSFRVLFSFRRTEMRDQNKMKLTRFFNHNSSFFHHFSSRHFHSFSFCSFTLFIHFVHSSCSFIVVNIHFTTRFRRHSHWREE